MGGGSKQTETNSQQQTATNAIDPQQLALLQGNYAGAQSRASSLVPYTGQITAGFNPTQTQSQGLLSDLAVDPRYNQTNQSAVNGVQGVLGGNINPTIAPQSVTQKPYTNSTYTAGQLAGTDLSPYMNPFQSSVIDASTAQNQYARQQQGVLDNATATSAGAFGGTRQAVQRAETTGQYDRNDQQNLAALNSANFTQAQAAAGTDIAARNAASQFNASGANAAGQFNAGQDLNAQQFNSGQNVNAQQDTFANTLAAQGLKVNAAGQLVSLNDSALAAAAQQGGILASVGDAQQAQQQTELTNAYNAYMAGQQLTVAQQQMLNSALGLIPNQQTISSSGSGTGTTTKQGDVLGGILGAIAGGAKVGSSLYGGN